MIRKAERPTREPVGSSADRLKSVPSDARIRATIREGARRLAAGMDRSAPVRRARLEELCRSLLGRLELPDDYLGFSMVALSSEFWRPRFAAVPFRRRLLLLPHCLRKPDVCRGRYDVFGLECAGCGACPIASLKEEATSLGYHVLIAEGTPAVVQLITSGKADAILGVSCLDSLEKAFERVGDLGIPHVAAPLLADGCFETAAELDHVMSLMRLHAPEPEAHVRSYVPLLRAAERLFEPGILDALLAGEILKGRLPGVPPLSDPMLATEAIAVDWLSRGGKRFRPFITLAGYAAMTLGEPAFHSDAELADAFPDVVQRTAVAVEALHKASLVHDDVEDDDAYRYGTETLHRRYGVAAAVNVGDYLVGLGYRLIASGTDELGPECVSEMLAVLSRSHLRLSRGQGAELLSRGKDPWTTRPLDALSIYALKTSPAFEAALFMGLRAAAPVAHLSDRLATYCRYLGVAFQVLNDLKDWTTDGRDKVLAGQDLLSLRPTVLQAFAFDRGGGAEDRELLAFLGSDAAEDRKLARLRGMYEARGVFEKARTLVGKYRQRALAAAAGVEPTPLRELMHFIVDVVLG
jgi:geranylgeranyl pyrophosphate synthase